MFSGTRKTCCNKHIIWLLFRHIYLTSLFLVMPLLSALLAISCRQNSKKTCMTFSRKCLQKWQNINNVFSHPWQDPGNLCSRTFSHGQVSYFFPQLFYLKIVSRGLSAVFTITYAGKLEAYICTSTLRRARILNHLRYHMERKQTYINHPVKLKKRNRATVCEPLRVLLSPLS